MNDKFSASQVLLETNAPKILSVQALLIVGIAWSFYYYQEQLAAQSALFGGLIAMLNVWITQRRMQSAARIAETSPGREVVVFYIAAIQRFVFTIGLFLIGMGLLKFPPVPLLLTFAVAQVGYLFKSRTQKSEV